MPLDIEELEVLKLAEQIADRLWAAVSQWENFEKHALGSQVCRSADSIGANIAEAYGRYHFLDRNKFLYYARGSLFETKYWVNRSHSRNLFTAQLAQDCSADLTQLTRQLNALINITRAQVKKGKHIAEPSPEYLTETISEPLFTETDLTYLAQLPE